MQVVWTFSLSFNFNG